VISRGYDYCSPPLIIANDSLCRLKLSLAEEKEALISDMTLQQNGLADATTSSSTISNEDNHVNDKLALMQQRYEAEIKSIRSKFESKVKVYSIQSQLPR
jgi:hypothetical protein